LASLETISKNDGISLLFLDPSESEMQLFHHGTLIGGSWSDPEKHLITILASESNAKPIKILPNFIKDVKVKTYSVDKFIDTLSSEEEFMSLKNPKTDFTYKNIISLPNLLTKTFLGLESKDPITVAMTFLKALITHNEFLESYSTLAQSDNETDDNINSDETSTNETKPELIQENDQFLPNFIHIIQFCHLCIKVKIPAVHYKIPSSPAVDKWFLFLISSCSLETKNRHKHTKEIMNIEMSSEDETSSPNHNTMKTNHHLISTMLKIKDNLEKHSLKIQKDSDEKEPGFAKLEEHRRLMILNASTTPPFDSPANSPANFLRRKSQFKAKEQLTHRLMLEKISFNPRASFVTCLWNADFFWILPDSPSGISIFFCPESKSLNPVELEKERSFALIDKVKANKLEKLSKQKLYILTSIMDMIFMTQNLQTVIFLCFGDSSISASFLLGWTNHMYKNRLLQPPSLRPIILCKGPFLNRQCPPNPLEVLLP
jgi:hypothetical protein